MFCFAKFCRLCLNNSNDLVDIFEDSGRIMKKLEFLRPRLISSSDGLPPWVCLDCHSHIKKSFNHVKKWIKSQETLKGYKLQLELKNKVFNCNKLSVRLNNFQKIIQDMTCTENNVQAMEELLETVMEPENRGETLVSDISSVEQPNLDSNMSEDTTSFPIPENILEKAIGIAEIPNNAQLTSVTEQNISQILKNCLDFLPTVDQTYSTNFLQDPTESTPHYPNYINYPLKQGYYSGTNEISAINGDFTEKTLPELPENIYWNSSKITTPSYINIEEQPFEDYHTENANFLGTYNTQNGGPNPETTYKTVQNQIFNNRGVNIEESVCTPKNYYFSFSSVQYTPPISPNITNYNTKDPKNVFNFDESSGAELNKKCAKFRTKANNKENIFCQVIQDMEIASRHCNTSIKFVFSTQNGAVMLTVDKKKSVYRCDSCGVVYPNSNQILGHLSIHISTQSLTDNEYIAVNMEKQDESVKLVVNHEIKKFVCLKCDKNFSEFAALYRHVAVHVSNQRYFCDECGKSFPVNRYLSLHKLTHSRIKVYACKSCPKTFRAKDTLKTHELVHHFDSKNKPFICEICGKGFAIDQYLKIHLKRHNNDPGSVCHICGKTLKTEELCYKHIKEKHLSIVPKQCGICNKTFQAARNLKAHMKLHGSKDHKCNQCEKEFFFKRDLHTHYLIHTGLRPHVCQYCKKDFRSPGALRKHIKTHFRVYPYVCKICQKGFGQIGTLQAHERGHFGQKPFRCHCGKSYVKNSVLKQHIKKIHPELVS